MGVVLLDSVAIVAFLDRANVFHPFARTVVRGQAAEHRLVASVVTLAEVLTGARLGHHDEARVRGFFDDLISAMMPVDRPVAERAAQLRGARKALRLPDALILATADLHADAAITADARWLQVPGLDCEVSTLQPRR